MVLALTWTGWSGLMATVGVILALWARHAWRAAVREELLDYLAHAAPEVAITDVHVGSLVYQGRDGGAVPRTIALDAFYRQLGAHPGGTAESEAARLEVFATVAITMRARDRQRAGSPARCRGTPAPSGRRRERRLNRRSRTELPGGATGPAPAARTRPSARRRRRAPCCGRRRSPTRSATGRAACRR